MEGVKWDLGRLNKGELSALRRSAGADVRAAGMDALRAFYKACGHCDRRLEEYWFAAMCMEALWREEEDAREMPMEDCLRELLSQEKEATESMQHRIDMLLETRWDNDGFLLGKLLNQVKLLKSRTNLKPDFQKLADDLCYWNHDRHNVQRRWLWALYNAKPATDEEEDVKNAD